MVPVQQFVALALKQTGDEYVFGVEHTTAERDPDTWDCSELTSWCAARLKVNPPLPDGAYNQWRHCTRISVAEALRTRGALLFVGDGTGTGRDAITHVAISLGNDQTIEARGRRWGVGSWSAIGRFTYAGRIPGIDYTTHHQEDDVTEAQLQQRVDLLLSAMNLHAAELKIHIDEQVAKAKKEILAAVKAAQ